MKDEVISKDSDSKNHNQPQSRFRDIPKAPPIAIFQLNEAYKRDSHPRKIDLGIGAYRDDTGYPFFLRSVKHAMERLSEEDPDFDYLAQTGLRSFTELASELLLGQDNPALEEDRVVSCQSLGGTGALWLAARLLHDFLGYDTAYYSNPTWNNHIGIFKSVGFKNVRPYRYWCAETKAVDFPGLMEDLSNAPQNSVVILHTCCHNPTGTDLSREQWIEVSQICRSRHLFPLFDCAYQGFASGDLNEDVWSFRYFVEQGFETICCHSFSKSFGLYNQRIGNLVIVSNSSEYNTAISSQLSLIIRQTYSNPSAFGAQIISLILSKPSLFRQWKSEIVEMYSRLKLMRGQLFEELCEHGAPGDWTHITNQVGMFCYSGLSKQAINRLLKEYHVYMTQDGRISICGLNSNNISLFGEAMAKIVEEESKKPVKKP